MALLDSLMEMGFEREQAESALRATGSSNLEAAINWIISNQEGVQASGGNADNTATPNLEGPKEASTVEIMMNDPPSADVQSKIPEEARSIKCEDCGKLFRTEDEVHFHAVKSGHANFSESTDEVKPLTEEERRERMQALQERLKKKRLEKEEEEKKTHVELEKQRRLTGQQILASKQRIEEQEMKKIADDKKRQKKEDALTKKRILDQIKLDREAKKQQSSGGAASSSEPKAAAEPAPAPVASVPVEKKSYDQCQLQIRLINGSILKQTFGAKEPLSAVRLWVQLQSGDLLNEPFTFMTNFPRRVFNDEDMETPLAELGLVPSANLILTRKQSG